uniref:Pco126957 n=1 Tax=Arundo donax TaxID=35708 RepID=A0A0A9EB66_ARUDO
MKTVKENFVIVYQILDEMMDNGFPLTTEANILKEMIAPPNIVNKMLNIVTGKSSTLGSKLPDATASFVPWRTTVVKDANNEVYVNIIEELDACINRYFIPTPSSCKYIHSFNLTFFRALMFQ